MWTAIFTPCLRFHTWQGSSGCCYLGFTESAGTALEHAARISQALCSEPWFSLLCVLNNPLCADSWGLFKAGSWAGNQISPDSETETLDLCKVQLSTGTCWLKQVTDQPQLKAKKAIGMVDLRRCILHSPKAWSNVSHYVMRTHSHSGPLSYPSLLLSCTQPWWIMWIS